MPTQTIKRLIMDSQTAIQGRSLPRPTLQLAFLVTLSAIKLMEEFAISA
jgi:hypothetical protein